MSFGTCPTTRQDIPQCGQLDTTVNGNVTGLGGGMGNMDFDCSKIGQREPANGLSLSLSLPALSLSLPLPHYNLAIPPNGGRVKHGEANPCS